MEEKVEYEQQLLSLSKKQEEIHVTVEPDITKVEKFCSSTITARLTKLFAFLNWSWVIPYKIVYSDKFSEYKVELSIFRMVTIWMFQASFTIYHFIAIFHMTKRDSSMSSIIRSIITPSLTCWVNVIIFGLWKNRHSFAKIITDVRKISFSLENRGVNLKTKKVSTTIAVMICICCIVVSFLEISLFAFKVHQNERYLKPWLVLDEQGSPLDKILPAFESTFTRNLLIRTAGFVHAMVNRVYFFTVGHFGYALLLLFSVSVRDLYQALNSTIQKYISSIEELDEIVNLYTTLHRFTTDVNRALGTLMAWGILCHLPYNAYKVKDVLYGNIFIQISYIIHVALYLAVLYAGAGVHSQIHAILDKLASDKLVLRSPSLQSKVSLLLQQSRWAGMRGGGYFLITYGFLGNIIGVITTYAILIVQSHNHH